MGELAKTDAADAEVPDVPSGAPADATASVTANLKLRFAFLLDLQTFFGHDVPAVPGSVRTAMGQRFALSDWSARIKEATSAPGATSVAQL